MRNKGVCARLDEFNRYSRERLEALISFDEEKIRNHFEKWEVTFPEDGKDFWESVARAVLLTRHDVPDEARMEALRILDELNVEHGYERNGSERLQA